MSYVDLDIRVCFVQALQSFRRCDNGHKFDLLSAMLLDEIHGSHGRAAGGQHRVGDNDGSLVDRSWELAVVFVWFVGLLDRKSTRLNSSHRT